jgi:hypothetical protein
MVDVEATRPVPNVTIGVMTELGAVMVGDKTKTFYFDFRTGHPKDGMRLFAEWLKEQCGNAPPRFISDNNGFDWQHVNQFFWVYYGSNPFGYSSTNLGSLFKGMQKTMFKNFKHLRKTKHTHHPVDDCMGNVEALQHMATEMGLEGIL